MRALHSNELKLDDINIPKTTLNACKKIADERDYICSPFSVYEEIRSAFSIGEPLRELLRRYPLELLEEVEKQVFTEVELNIDIQRRIK